MNVPVVETAQKGTYIADTLFVFHLTQSDYIYAIKLPDGSKDLSDILHLAAILGVCPMILAIGSKRCVGIDRIDIGMEEILYIVSNYAEQCIPLDGIGRNGSISY